MRRRSPVTQRTNRGIYERLASWLAKREGVGREPVTALTPLGRRRRDGGSPDAGGRLSSSTPIRIVHPIMLQVGVRIEQAHPHPLRHTFGQLYVAARQAGLSRRQRIMGHASPESTSRYVHHDEHELAAEHRRIERLRSNPLARRQERRRTRAAGRSS